MRALTLLALLVAVAAALAAQPASMPSQPPGILQRWADLPERLGALAPERPAEYLRLGEMILLDARTPEDARLARHLLGVAVDRLASSGRPGEAASACVALASTAQTPQTPRERAWLVALARALEPSLAAPEWLAGPAPVDADAVNERAAAALALLRAGEPRKARPDLEDAGVRAALLATPEVKALLAGRSLDALIAEMSEGWPCPQCRNNRFVQTGDGATRTQRLCPSCGGDPGPALSPQRLELLLRAELRLVGGVEGSWSAAVAAGRGQAVRTPDPAGVGGVLGIETSLAWWRGGRWVNSPGGR